MPVLVGEEPETVLDCTIPSVLWLTAATLWLELGAAVSVDLAEPLEVAVVEALPLPLEEAEEEAPDKLELSVSSSLMLS